MTEETFTIKINIEARELSVVRHLGEGRCNVAKIQFNKLKHGLLIALRLIREVLSER
jgi:hypothetical protein